MLPTRLAFVDIETTGTSSQHDRIIEIAIITLDDGVVVDQYSTLVNPRSSVSPFVEQLTGISVQDLEEAPSWSEIAPIVYEKLDGALFVAHNVRFDYGFIKNEFNAVGVSFSARQLCTVRLSRALYPRHRRHNLDSVIERHGIICEARHRALGDTQAICEFYLKMSRETPPEKFAAAIKSITRAPSIPPGLRARVVDSLPEHAGVYVFYGENHVPLYVGKSINIRDRVKSHFMDDHRRAAEMSISRQIIDIEAIETSGEMGALLLEQHMIKELQPLYNRRLRRMHKLLVLKSRVNNDGYMTMYHETVEFITPEDLESIHGIYKSLSQLKSHLRELARAHNLCEALLGLEKRTPCFGTQIDICRGACDGRESAIHYNGRVIEAFAGHKIRTWPYPGPVALVEQDKTRANTDGYVVDKWCYVGRLSQEEQDISWRRTNDYVFDYDVYKILVRSLMKPTRALRIIQLPGVEEVEQAHNDSYPDQEVL